MCGVTGFVAQHPRAVQRFLHGHNQLAHRGPDDEGFVAHGAAGVSALRGTRTIRQFGALPRLEPSLEVHWILGHHRLSIVDLSPGGHQPMGYAQRYWIAFNGEIYNHVELRDELSALGRTFRSQSDTEVILQAFDQWGVQCFSRFNGMWAIALIDTQSQRLWLCRDRAGVKPLYWTVADHTLYFASELRFMRSVLDAAQLDEALAADFLATARSEHHEQTLIRGVNALRPGHYLTTALQTLQPQLHAYWQLPDPARDTDLSHGEALSELQRLLDSAIDLRMRSDVPVGSLLSGGLDSTAIVTNLAQRGRIAQGSFHSYSAVYPQAAYSERSYVEATVRRYPQIVPHYVTPDAAQIVEDLPRLMEAADGPMRSMAVYAQYCIYRDVARDGIVKVLLNGQGADELFAGYTSYRTAWAAEALPHLARALSRLGPHRAHAFRPLLAQLRWMLALRMGRDSTGLDTTMPIRGLPGEPAAEAHAAPLRRQLRRSLQMSALPEYLRYEDRNSMHFSVESRLPFLDYRLIEFAARLPGSWLLTATESKYILRQAVASYLTPEVAARRDKQGFVTPQLDWQREVMRDFMLGHLRDCRYECIAPEHWRAWLQEYETEFRDPFFAWRAVSLHLWQKSWGL